MAKEVKELVEGLDLGELDDYDYLPPELVSRLDLVYFLGNDLGRISDLDGIDVIHKGENIGGIQLEIRKLHNFRRAKHLLRMVVGTEGGEYAELVREMPFEDMKTSDVYIFGALYFPHLTDFAAVPVFSFERELQGERIDHLNATQYRCFAPIGKRDNLLSLRSEAINVTPEGTYCYLGAGNDVDAVVFDEPLAFDLEKRLILVRSPNRTVSFDEIGKQSLKEGQETFDYSLVYENLRELVNGKNYAIHGTRGLTWECNLMMKLEIEGLLQP